MAIEYGFEMVAQRDPEEALALLVAECGFRWGPEWGRVPYIGGYGLWIPAIPALQSAQQIYQAAFGFRPTLSLTFRVQTEDYDTAMTAISRAIGALLRHETGDALLNVNGDLVLLQRIKGKLLVDSNLNPSYVSWIVKEGNLSAQIVELPQKLM